MLDVVWYPAKQRYMVIRKNKDGQYDPIFFSESPEGHYRDLGEWILEKLRRMDAWDKRNKLMELMAGQDMDMYDKAKAELSDWVRGSVADTMKYVVKKNGRLNYTAPSSKTFDLEHYKKQRATKDEAWAFLDRVDRDQEKSGVVSMKQDGTFTVKT